MRQYGRLRLLMVVILAGCTAVPTTETPTPTAGQSTEPIVIALPLPPHVPAPFFRSTNAIEVRIAPSNPELASRLVYSAVYRYDDSLSPVPDLAAEPCEISEDGLTITCELVEAAFHDGSPLTADDVAFSYELGRRSFIYELGERVPYCLFAFGSCFDTILESATALDERTVQFRLARPDATFLTLVMPDVLIDSRAVVEAAYAPLAERAATLDPGDYEAGERAIVDVLDADDPDCGAPLAGADELLVAAGLEPLPREMFNRPDGTFDECLYAQQTAPLLAAVAASLRATGLDAIALAYQALSFNSAPVGTGPFRWGEVLDGTRLQLEAYEAYHGGAPATEAIEIRVTRDLAAAQQALLDGDIHALPIPLFGLEMYQELRPEPDLRFVEFGQPSFFTLAYNLREGMLFADRNLRAALELCIDKPATVDAATQGTGEPIYSYVPPVSWAYNADLPRPPRDIGQARDLIEASGWSEAEDGVYERGGERLATEIFVTAEETQRLAFMELVAEQARDCGFELTIVPADRETVLVPVGIYPHVPGGRDEPFEAHFVGWGMGYDPHAGDLFHSTRVSSEERPRDSNFMGFQNEQVDELLDAGLTTYAERDRARIYRELQEIIAEEKPFLFAWSSRGQVALDARLGYTEGEINLASPQWFWQPEKLVLREGD
jgi:ABC-type transport system substrate-binding protein